MDPTSAALLGQGIAAVANGAAGEAGKSAWAALGAGVRRLVGHGSPSDLAVQAVEQAPRTEVVAASESAVRVLAAEAAVNPGLGEFLREWSRTATDTTSVTNVVAGGANIGQLLQARDLSGPVSFGGHPDPRDGRDPTGGRDRH